MPVYAVGLEQQTLLNRDYRRVLHTTDTMQLVLMTLQPGEVIPAEVHAVETQFIRVDGGEVQATSWSRSGGAGPLVPAVRTVGDGAALVIAPGTRHEVRNVSSAPAHLYTIYTFPPGQPPHAEGEVDARQPGRAK